MPNIGAKGGQKSAAAFRTISEVGTELNVAAHVLRFWESKFPQIKPMKRGGNRRYYRPEDIDLLRTISELLYKDGYTIKGVQKLFKENGVKSVMEGGTRTALAPANTDAEVGAIGNLDLESLQALIDELSAMREELIAANRS